MALVLVLLVPDDWTAGSKVAVGVVVFLACALPLRIVQPLELRALLPPRDPVEVSAERLVSGAWRLVAAPARPAGPRRPRGARGRARRRLPAASSSPRSSTATRRGRGSSTRRRRSRPAGTASSRCARSQPGALLVRGDAPRSFADSARLLTDGRGYLVPAARATRTGRPPRGRAAAPALAPFWTREERLWQLFRLACLTPEPRGVVHALQEDLLVAQVLVGRLTRALVVAVVVDEQDRRPRRGGGRAARARASSTIVPVGVAGAGGRSASGASEGIGLR